MHISKTGRHLPIRPEILSIVCGVLWAAALLLLVAATLLTPAGTPTLIYDFVAAALPGFDLSFTGVLLGTFWAFAAGYLFGFLIGFVYKLLIRKKLRKLSTPMLKINPAEQPFTIQEGTGETPYTIVFVANPFINVEKPDGSYEVQIDPIMGDKALFHQVVVRCLRSFANNELLRQPEIFNRMRLIIYFDPEIELAILRDRPVTLNPDEAFCIGINRSILGPISDTEKISNYVKEKITSYSDVVYLISASDIYTRSAARFSEEKPLAPGVDYRFTFTSDSSSFDTRRHAYCAELPGVVALSAWDDRLKTPVHEFAHAMSSVQNGAIDDEYIDDTFASLTHRINKQYRVGFILNDAALEQLKQPPGGEEPLPHTVIGKLLELKDRPFADQTTFETDVRSVLNNNEFNQFGDTILLYGLFKPVFFFTDQAIAKIINNIDVEGDKDAVQNTLREMKGKRYLSRPELYSDYREKIRDRSLFLRYRSLIARFAHFQNYPVPNIYARYRVRGDEERIYYSDRNRSDKEMSWRSYSPARTSTRLSCIMDIAVYGYRFDKLLFDWMYDRLYAKMNRPATACSHPMSTEAVDSSAQTQTNIQVNLLNKEERS